MKLSDYKQDFYTFSGTASEVSRTAAFAGIALVWIFKIDSVPIPKVPDDLLLPTGLFALGLALDLFHYVLGALIWGLFHGYHEKKLKDSSDDPELSHSRKLSCPLYILFYLKIGCVIAGYWLVCKYITNAWLNTSA